MNAQLRHFLILIGANTLLALLYLLCSLILGRKKKEERGAVLVRTAVMLLCPLIGPAFLLLGYLIFRIFSLKDLDLTDVVFSKDRVATYSFADEERERNYVPLEEAIIISDKDNLRNLMMNVIRGDISQSLASISLALNSEDSETSHYAASVLQEALDQFRTNVSKQRQLVLEGSENAAEIAPLLLDYMDSVLKQHVFTDIEQESFVRIMDEVAEALRDLDPSALTAAREEAVALRLLEVSDYENSRKWCDMLELYYPNELCSYTCRLKLYFSMNQRDSFFRVMEELKESSIIIDSETLELIRVFQ